MKFCISNIAWQKEDNKKVLGLLRKKKIKYIEFATEALKKNHSNISYNKIYNIYFTTQ